MLHNAMPINTALLETSDAKQEDGSIIAEEVGKYSGIIYEQPSHKARPLPPSPPPPQIFSPPLFLKKTERPFIPNSLLIPECSGKRAVPTNYKACYLKNIKKEGRYKDVRYQGLEFGRHSDQ